MGPKFSFLAVSSAFLVFNSAAPAHAGFTQPVGNTQRDRDIGWNLNPGAGYNFIPRIGALVRFDNTSPGINSNTLANVGFPGGNVNIRDFTLDPIVHLMPRGTVDAYIIGGVGIYHRTQEFTAPKTAVTAFDPFFGFYTVGVPATQVLSSYPLYKPGVNMGAGFAMGAITFIPITFR